MFKKLSIFLMLASLFVVSLSAVTPPTKAMQYRTVEEVYGMILSSENFLLLDLRKAEDYNRGHINIAVNCDLTDAVDGNYDPSIAALKAVLKKETGSENGGGKAIVLACYTGNRYAQAATNIISYLGGDLKKVYTLQGGNTAWNSSKYNYLVISDDTSFCSINGFDDVEISTSSLSGDFDFSRRRGDSEMDIATIMDIMSITTPCAFESYAAECGYEAYTELYGKSVLDQETKELVSLLRNGTYELNFVNGHVATGLRVWDSNNEYLSLMTDPGFPMAYCVYDDVMMVVSFVRMKYNDAYSYMRDLAARCSSTSSVTDGVSIEMEGYLSGKHLKGLFNGKEMTFLLENN